MSSKQDPKLASLVTHTDESAPAFAVAPGIYGSLGISNCYLIETNDGNILINSGMAFEAEITRRRFAAISDAPVRVLIFTQSHGDHIGGAAALAPNATIIAQSDWPAVRGYWNRLAPFYKRRTGVLWGSFLGNRNGSIPQPPDPEPDVLVEDCYQFKHGGLDIELLATPGGETTDSLVVWMPEKRTMFTGNLFGPIFGHIPNLYSIRGDKIRSALQFVESIDRVRALEPELLVTGHGEPIRGRWEITRQLTDIRAAVLWIHDQTIEGMNAGKTVHQLMAEIELPPHLAIGQGHGKTSWCVRAIWEEYAGWFHYQSTTELYAVPQRAIHPDLVELAGAKALVDRARSYLDAGQALQALHLTDIVLGQAPHDSEALRAQLGALEQLLEAAGENFSETQWLRSRIAETQDALTGPMGSH